MRALATAGLFGNVVRTNASVSGAEVGCQGEVGVACAMAAAAASQLFGGTPAPVSYTHLAILGFVLVLMYKWPTKLLAGITLYLFLGGATLVPVAYKSLTAPAVEQVEERMAERPASRPAGPRKVQTLSETIESNAWDGIVGKMRFQVSSGRIYLTLGLFILGFIVGRIRLFERMDEFRGRLNRWALLALAGLGPVSYTHLIPGRRFALRNSVHCSLSWQSLRLSIYTKKADETTGPCSVYRNLYSRHGRY